MKLKQVEKKILNKEVNFDISQLYIDYGDKEVYDLLKQNIIKDIINEKIKVDIR